jgi:hypothetical protein
VSFTAEPDSNLQSGQRIAFTLSVTNHGLEAAAPISLLGSPIFDEFDLSTGTSDCGQTLGLAIVDLDDSFYYAYVWSPTMVTESPLAVGETRNCHLELELSEWAPDIFNLTFAFPYWLVDLDPSNNSATATLQRAPAGSPPVPLPSTSIGGVLLLATALLGLATRRLRRVRQG